MPLLDTLGSIWRSVRSTLGKAFLSPSIDAREHNTPTYLVSKGYGDLRNRLARYSLGEALYENTTYDNVHPWAASLRFDFKLSSDIAHIFNPTKRVVDFYSHHVYPGRADRKAGNGKRIPSSIPIVAEDEAIRIPIAACFESSQIDMITKLAPRIGAMCGEVGLYAVLDSANDRTYIEVVHPRNIVEYVADPTGIVEHYRIEEWWDDPRPEATIDSPMVIRREDGDLVRDPVTGKAIRCRFRTYIGGEGEYKPYVWPGNPSADWEENYPFVPLVMVAHIKVDQRSPFGQFEVAPLFPKINKLEQAASRLWASIGKNVDPIWLFAGVLPSELEVILGDGSDGSVPAIAGGTEAKAQALVSTLRMDHVNNIIQTLITEIEKELPEIVRDIEHATGDSSGTALRVAQQRIETKAQARRAAYDHGFHLALTYCVRMGGAAKLPDYAGFSVEEIAANPDKIKFSIGHRPIFQVSALDELLKQKELFQIIESADRSGMTIQAYCEVHGMEDWIPIIDKAQKDAMAKGLTVGRSKQASPEGEAAGKASQVPGATAP